MISCIVSFKEIIKFLFALLCVCVSMLHHMREAQRTTCRSQFSSSTMWALGIGHWLSGSAAGIFACCVLLPTVGPPYCLC